MQYSEAPVGKTSGWDYVLDYAPPLKNVIMETESGDNALMYR